MMGKAAPVLMFGDQRVGVDPERQLMQLAELWVEVDRLGPSLRDLERRVDIQDRWLDANRDHPLWSSRVSHARIVRDEWQRTMNKVHEIARAANRLTDEMSEHTKVMATEHVHAWAGLGSCAVYAIAWRLVPDKHWLDEAVRMGERLKQQPCPF
jgi:hypothetical protein